MALLHLLHRRKGFRRNSRAGCKALTTPAPGSSRNDCGNRPCANVGIQRTRRSWHQRRYADPAPVPAVDGIIIRSTAPRAKVAICGTIGYSPWASSLTTAGASAIPGASAQECFPFPWLCQQRPVEPRLPAWRTRAAGHRSLLRTRLRSPTHHDVLGRSPENRFQFRPCRCRRSIPTICVRPSRTPRRNRPVRSSSIRKIATSTSCKEAAGRCATASASDGKASAGPASPPSATSRNGRTGIRPRR